MHESKAPQPRDRAVPLVYFRVAALNLATRSAGTRPRSFTSMPCALAHSRTSLSLAAIKVLDEQGLYLMGHRFAISSLPHHQPRPAETYKSATTWIFERSQAREAIAPHRRLCADQITTAGGPRRVPFAVHQTSTEKGGRRTAGYSRGDAIAELALPSSARDSPAVSACLTVISPYDTGCPPSIT